MKVQYRQERTEQHNGFAYRVVSYQLGEKFHAQADNISPGAVLARTVAGSRAEAEAKVETKAQKLLSETRTFDQA